MKLIYKIIIRLSVALSLVLVIWATFFYFTLIDEINDEVDDSLEDYAEQIIMRSLAGEEMPTEKTGSNNEYFLSKISPQEAQIKPHISYTDSMMYITTKREYEPARVLNVIYKDENQQFFELVVTTPTIEKDDLKEAILYWIIILYFGLLLVILIINVWIYHTSNRPLYKLLNWLDKYTVGVQNEPLINNTNITEFKKLNESAIRNMKRAQEVFEEQKLFIGNASHEIQTPIAICLNRLENLIDDGELSQHQLEELSKTCETLHYITKLNKSLLLLSKIDNKQFKHTHTINLNTVIQKLKSDYQEVFSYKKIELKLTEKGQFVADINEDLASILINNLMKNAYVHNTTKGTIEIEITNTSIIFKNTSTEYALNPKLIFERFYQGNKKKGTIGLGLALVKSICELENLNLSYYFENNLHCFKISK